jgi:hypothetical protein
MKSLNQRVSQVIFGAAIALFGAASLVQVDQLPQPESDIFSPTAVEAGVMTVFSVQGSDVQWTVIPYVPMTIYGEGNSFMATSFKEEGSYTVVSAYQVEGKTQLRVSTVSVGVSSEQEVAPEPEQPVVEPEPIDEPEVSEIPTKYPDVALYIERSARESNLDKDIATQLSNNFTMVARDIENGVLEVPRQVTTATVIANRRLNLTSQTAIDIQKTITSFKVKGELETVEDYKDLWTQIAQGLNNYAR